METLRDQSRLLGRGSAVAIAVGLSLSGCSAVGSVTHSRDGADEIALVAQEISDERPGDIDGFARAAVADIDATTYAEGESVRLVGISSQTPASINDPLGTLSFLVRYDPSSSSSAGSTGQQNCFEVEFDYYGYTGDWALQGSVDPAIHGVDCPADPVSVIPPPDTSEHPVVAENAAAVFSEALAAIPLDVSPDAAQLAADIRGKLTPPTGEFEVAAEVGVLVRGTDIGVSMGDGDHCVLVSRRDGVVEELHAPRELLQPGEYGCRADTALLDGDQLRSPH